MMTEKNESKLTMPVFDSDYKLFLEYEVLKGKKNLQEAFKELIRNTPFNFSIDELRNAINIIKPPYNLWRLKIIKNYVLHNISDLDEKNELLTKIEDKLSKIPNWFKDKIC